MLRTATHRAPAVEQLCLIGLRCFQASETCMHLAPPRACQAGRAPVWPENSEATTRRLEAIRRLRIFRRHENNVISLVTY